MKKGFYFLIVIGFALNFVFTVSCNKVPTYEEMRTAERKLINRVIQNKKLEILSEFPRDGVFASNPFVVLENGLYIQVIDSGNGNRAILNETTVLARVSGELYEKNDTIPFRFDFFTNGAPLLDFKYGHAISVAMDPPSMAHQIYFGAGLELALDYVGENGEVRMLIPGHAEMRVGSSLVSAASFYQTSEAGSGQYVFIPIYYDRVKFTFY
jgi:hypothetical protein